MTIESDTLKTLQAIEKHLAAASKASGATAGSRLAAADERKQDAEDRKNNKIIVGTIKNIDEMGTSAYHASKSLQGLNKNAGKTTVGLGDLSVELDKTITQFTSARGEIGKISIGSQMSALQEAVEAAADSIKKTRVGTIDTTRAVVQLGKLDQMLDNQVIPRLGTFNSALRMATAGLVEIWDDLKEERKDTGMKELGKSISIAITAMSRKGGIGTQLELMTRMLRDVNKQLRSLKGNIGSIGGGGGGGGGRGRGSDIDDPSDPGGRKKQQNGLVSFFKSSRFTSPIYEAFTSSMNVGWRRAIDIIDDAFQVTAARGFGTTDSLLTLYTNAALAGMELREYAKLMDDNMSLVARSGSFKEFDKRLDTTRDQLAKLGTFGIEATQLAAAMQNSAATLGVPIKDVSNASEQQVKIFGQLQKSVGATAEQFQAMVLQLQENEAVQKELLGLAPQDRANRLNAITKTAAWAKSLGMGDAATRALTEALLAQRKSTVKERFNQRGRLTQAFALAGFDAAKTEEVRTLASKRNRTTEEDQRFTALLGEYAQRAEEMKQRGGEGTQFQFETMDEKLAEVGIKPLLDAAGQARQATQAGQTGVNQDMGKTLNRIEVAIGKGITILEGISKSPLFIGGMAIIGAGLASLIASSAVRSGALSFLASPAGMRLQATMIGQAVAAAIRGTGGIGTPDAPDAGGKGGKGKWAGRLGKIGMFAATAGPAIFSGISALSDLSDAQKEKAEGKEGANEKEGEAIGKGIGGTAGAALGIVLSGFIGAFTGGLGLAATGIITSITTGLGAWAGGLLGGWLKKDTVQEKNTKELQKNTEELVKQNRVNAGASVIGTDQLDTISANVLQTAKAYAAPTEAELQKYAESKMTPEERAAAQAAKASKVVSATPTTPTEGPSAALANIRDNERRRNERFAASAAATSAAQIASPTPQVRASVTPADVNKPTPEVQPTEPKKPTVQLGAQQPQAQDAATILAQILQVLQQSLSAENQQVDLTTQLIRAQNAVRLYDNQQLTRQVLSQA